MTKTRKNNRTRGWKKQKPGFHQRTIMLKKCGKKTCKISRQGVQSAYIRAKQFNHSAIAKKAKTLLRKINISS